MKFLVSLGLADPEHVGIGVGSHGGTVAANAVSKLPGTFAAGLELFGVVDRALFRSTPIGIRKFAGRQGWEARRNRDRPFIARRIPDVAKITTPLLILHGEEDPQVPPQESMQLVDALKKAGNVYYVTSRMKVTASRLESIDSTHGRNSLAFSANI